MLFKLSIKNMKKSFKDYAIYFLTLVLGVAIFYMFNSLDSQAAMLEVSSSTSQMIKLMINILGYISVFVAIILGLLIVYANNFLINRRKKEFGIYMTLGMGKKQISKIILLETVFVGIISLGIGLVIGIFASQFMSVLVAKLFEVDMSNFKFVFSKNACIKTCIYFAVMYIAVIFFNTITVSRYKLINLLNATKKNEKVKIKNPIISVIIFIGASALLGYAYWSVTSNVIAIQTEVQLLIPILMGVIGTILVFWSLSGFILSVVKSTKNIYLKGTNMFVLRQINSKINTTVISMSVICLMLFMTISILSSSLALRNTMQREVKKLTPVDINLYTKYSDTTIQEILISNGFNINLLKDINEISIYGDKNLTLNDFMGDNFTTNNDITEELIKVSDYNKIAQLYGNEQYDLDDDEYIVVCNFDSMAELINQILENKNDIIISGKKYKSKYSECKDGFIKISNNKSNVGFIIVPDSCNLTDDMITEQLLVANYNAKTDDEKAEIETMFDDNSKLFQNINNNGIDLNGFSKISLMESSIGLTCIAIFIAIYSGVIFLIASAAILALKQLTESSDNKQRYTILRKIGCDENMINKALFSQIAIFFGLPLILAIIHSIFGIQFALAVLSGLASKEDLLPSVIATIIIIGIIYGVYFIATYFGSKNIIKEIE
jgi:putative ABC transport system permease protein